MGRSLAKNMIERGANEMACARASDAGVILAMSLSIMRRYRTRITVNAITMRFILGRVALHPG